MENNKYNPEGSDLRKFQLRMLEILKAVDRICRKHNIPYWLSCGTLLGAVRHGGFIPWDDDMDIEVKKEDYKRLLKVLEKELPENYVIHNFKTDKAYTLSFSKVRDICSNLKEKMDFDIDYKYKGAFLDIFPMEYIASESSKLSDCFFVFSFKTINKMRLKRLFGRRLVACILHYLMSFFIFICRLYSIRKKDKIYSSLCAGGLNYKIDESDIFPLQQMSFEGEMFYVPKDFNLYLRRIFGNDYMIMPPEENRIWHGSDFKVW